MIREGSNILPIRLNTKEAFNYMNPEHSAKAEAYLENKYAQLHANGLPTRGEQDWMSELSQGDWHAMEKQLGLDFYKDNGFSGAHEIELGERNFITHDPKNIRSRFAAFDPLRKNSPNILASGLLGGTVLANEYKKDKK